MGFAVGKVLLEEAELETVAVAVDARRRGVGRRLCCAVREWCVAQGAHEMQLEVRAGNAGGDCVVCGVGICRGGTRGRGTIAIRWRMRC